MTTYASAPAVVHVYVDESLFGEHGVPRVGMQRVARDEIGFRGGRVAAPRVTSEAAHDEATTGAELHRGRVDEQEELSERGALDDGP